MKIFLIKFLSVISFLTSLCRILFDNIWGLFFLLLSIYLFARFTSTFEVFTFTQLVYFLVSLPKEYLMWMTSSILTILGFLISFQQATTSWKSNKISELTLNIASKIKLTYEGAIDLTKSVQIFLATLKKFSSPHHPLNQSQYILQKMQRELSNLQTQILQINSQISNLLPQNELILERFPLVKACINASNTFFQLFTEELCSFRLEEKSGIDLKKHMKLENLCEKTISRLRQLETTINANMLKDLLQYPIGTMRASLHILTRKKTLLKKGLDVYKANSK